MSDVKSDQLEESFRAPLEAHEWEKYTSQGNVPYFESYIEATGGIVQSLEEKVDKCTSFDELKKELTEFLAARKAFIKHAINNYP